MPTFSNVWRQTAEGKDYVVLPIGKKAVEYFQQKGDRKAHRTVRRDCRMFLWQTVLRSHICFVRNSKKELLVILNLCYTSIYIHAFSAAGSIFRSSLD